MKGLGLNAGYVAWWGKTATQDAHVLQILWNAGAVFYARTTQPQSMMHHETDSNLYGVTVNPYNRNVSSGGSSGGEGALIAMRGSCLGIGSDIGGKWYRSSTCRNLADTFREYQGSCWQLRLIWLETYRFPSSYRWMVLYHGWSRPHHWSYWTTEHQP
jgi:hypothetical protein